MPTLIFQIHIKRWDKSQRLPADVAARAAIADVYPIVAKPEYFILNKACIIDQHGDDTATEANPSRHLKTSLMADGSVKLDRFIICETDGNNVLSYCKENQPATIIGNLNDGWIQAKYRWRYPVESSDQFYWQYEEFTLNAACTPEFEAHYFLTNPAKLIFDAPD